MQDTVLARVLRAEIESLTTRNDPLGVYLSTLRYFTTPDIMATFPFLSKGARRVLDTEEFWRARWLSDFEDQVSDIGPELPSWIVDVRHPKVDQLSSEMKRLHQSLNKTSVWPGDRDDTMALLAFLEDERNKYLGSPYVAWKKYWLWTYFFRRTLTRGIVNLINTKLTDSNRAAGDVGTYIVKLVDGRDSLISIQGGKDDLVTVYDVWSLIFLFDHWNKSWTDRHFAFYLPKNPPPIGMRPNDFGLPFACALIILKISPLPLNLNDMWFLNRVFPSRQSGFAMAMTTRNLQADSNERDALAQRYLDWYLYKTLEAIYTDPKVDKEESSKFMLVRYTGKEAAIRKFENLFEFPGQDRGNPVVHWLEGLRIILNEPRVGLNPRYGQTTSPDEQSNKIFLGAVLTTIQPTCLKCGVEASRQCKRCKSALYCGKECQVTHWSKEHKDLCIPFSVSLTKSLKSQASLIGHNFEDEEPTINVNNWDYEFAAKRFQSSLGKKEGIKLATKRMGDAELTGNRPLLVYWWWVVKLLKESFEDPWPVPMYTKKMPSTMRYLTYKEWARQAYDDTKARPFGTPKTREVRVAEATENIRRLAETLTSRGDPDHGFYWWVERELATYLFSKKNPK